MVYNVEYIKDVLGNNYIGVDINPNVINPFLNELKEYLKDDYEEYKSYQQKRDNGSYHITLINVAEYNSLVNKHGMDTFINSLDNIFKYEIDDLKMLGIGRASKAGNTTYFIVCKSDKMNAIRNRYGLKDKDIHITIGFKYKDVFGVPKNEVFKMDNAFLFELRSNYMRNENWNFVRKIENYDLDKYSEIIPIEIKDTTIKFKVDNYYIVVSWLDDKFWVTNKFPIDREYPRLSQNAILKKMNEI